METAETGVIRQHLIGPEICIRCNTCEATCPVGPSLKRDGGPHLETRGRR